MAKKERGLTAKQKLFVKEYLVDFNATQAAIRAKYSKNTADAIGHENLKKPKIAEAIEKAQEKLAKRTGVLTIEEIAEGLSRAIGFDIRKLYNDDGTLKKPTELDDDTALELAGFEVIEFVNKKTGNVTTTYKYKIPDKKGNREILGKHLGMFKEQVEHDLKKPLADLLAEIANKNKSLLPEDDE